jgi:hypothetical protein
VTTTSTDGKSVVAAGSPTAGGAGGIYAATNAQGQLVYATYVPSEAPPPGALAIDQVTLTHSTGATVVFEGGQLADVASGG